MGNTNSYATDIEVISIYPISSQQEYYDTLIVPSESDSITSPSSSVQLQQDSDTESEYKDPLNMHLESNTDNNHNWDHNYALCVCAQCNGYINLMRSSQPIGYHTMISTSITTSVITDPSQQDSDTEAQYAETLSVPSEWETDDDVMASIPTLITDNDNDQFGDQDEAKQDVELNNVSEQNATNSNVMLSQQHNDLHQDNGQFEYPPWDEYDADDSYNSIDRRML